MEVAENELVTLYRIGDPRVMGINISAVDEFGDKDIAICSSGPFENGGYLIAQEEMLSIVIPALAKYYGVAITVTKNDESKEDK